jgi:DNA-binding SARP family transcriptional activator
VLVKMLAARRGRLVTRDELREALWPDDEPERTAHRLSVLLSTVRAVLDPARTWPPEHYICADSTGLRLDLNHVRVDALDLLRDAAHAVALARRGEPEAAREQLADIDARYRGDAFDDEPYEEWADALREELRVTWQGCLRAAAALSARSGDHDQAVVTLVRLLGADAYDEQAHEALVTAHLAAGRHGEARRAFERWTAAMRAIDAPPPNPEVLAPGTGHRPLRPRA